jgi:aminopeptidase N
VLLFAQEQAGFRFVDLDAPAAVSLLRGLSAPVRIAQDVTGDALALLACHDDDGFNRWFAADALARRVFAAALAAGGADVAGLAGCLGAALADRAADPALLAEMLTLPDANSLAEGRGDIDPEAVHQAREHAEEAIAQALRDPLLARHRALAGDDGRSTTLEAQARRRLRNACLALLCRADARHFDLARAQFDEARNLTDRLAALSILVHHQAQGADAALRAFEARHAGDALVLDKWFALQATAPVPATLPRIEALASHPAFRWHNPNKVHALVGALALRNPRVFHRADGAGYRFVADAIVRVDALTPQVSARLATAFSAWRRYEPQRRARMRRELERLAAHPARSPDLADIVARSLAG